MSDAQFVMVMSTTDSAAEAKSLARGAIESRLAACVQSLQISSTYTWEGAVEESAEYLLLFKTSQDRSGDLQAYIADVHSYDTPEVVEVPIIGGAGAYLEWMLASTKA